MHVKDPAVHVSLVDYGKAKVTQHALKSVKSSEYWKLDTVWMKKKTFLHQELHQDLNVLLWGNSHFTVHLCKFFKSKGRIKNQ